MNSISDELGHLLRAFQFVTDWDLAIDGGANLGYWSLCMSEKFKTVLAFEPARDTFNMLLSNTKEVPNIIKSRVALGSKPGKCEVRFEAKRESSSSYHRSRFVKEGVGSTPLLSIDSLHFPSVGLIKLDLEGSEYFAVQGAVETIKRCRPVLIVEQDKFPQKRFGLSNNAAGELIIHLGAEKVDCLGKDAIYAFT